MIFPLLTTQCAQWYLSLEGFHLTFPFFISAVGASAVFYGFWKSSADSKAPESLSLSWGIGLGIVMGLGLALRLTHVSQPIGLFWIDQSNVLLFARQVADYGSQHLMFPNGSEGPFYVYSEAVFCKLFPGLSNLSVLRFSSAFWDFGSLVLFYFLGKELGGARVGVFLASLGAISRIMMFKCYLGVESPTLTTMVALAMLVQVRLFKKADFWRFIQWALGVVAGMYAYPAYRPWLLFLIVLTIGWLLWLLRDQKSKALVWGLGCWWILSATTAYCWAHHILEPADRIFYPARIILAVLSALALLLTFLYPGLKGVAYHPMRGLAAAMAVIAFFFFPLAENELFAARVQELNDFHLLESLSGFFGFIKANLISLFQIWFVTGSDRPTSGPVDETFFSFWDASIVLLGIIFAFARPDWKKGFLAVCLIPALFPWITIQGPHSSRMLACIVPLYALGALAMDRFWTLLEAEARKSWKISWILFFGFMVLWASWANLKSVWHWMDELGIDVIISRQALEDSQRARTYLAVYDCDVQSIDALVEKQPVYRMGGSNPIDLPPGAAKPDVVVLLQEADKKNIATVKAQFPKAQWSTLSNPWNGALTPVLERALIPADQISNSPSKIFYITGAQLGGWTRRFYDAQLGTKLGLILEEDHVMDLHAPFPAGVPDICSGTLSGEVSLGASGNYSFRAEPANSLSLEIDGRALFNYDGRGEDGKNIAEGIRLSEGVHQVSGFCFFQYGKSIPKVQVKDPGGVETAW